MEFLDNYNNYNMELPEILNNLINALVDTKESLRDVCEDMGLVPEDIAGELPIERCISCDLWVRVPTMIDGFPYCRYCEDYDD